MILKDILKVMIYVFNARKMSKNWIFFKLINCHCIENSDLESIQADQLPHGGLMTESGRI